MTSRVDTLPNSDRTRLGIALCLLSMLVFACQDGVTKVLVRDLPVSQLVMVRYWVFALFALGLAAYQGGIRAAVHTRHPWLQCLRALLGVLEIAIFAVALRFLGLAETHALYAVFPLMALALAGIVLREFIGSRQWIATAIGFIGTLVILRPGLGVFDSAALIPLLAALIFALFTILTRKISQHDSFATNTLYMALVGAVASTSVGLGQWVEPTLTQWLLIGVLSVAGILAHLLLLQALRYAPAGALQPYNYSLLVFATLVGLLVFGEFPDSWTLVGAALVLGGGLLALKTRR